jgi:hypothetical protein
MKSYFLRRNHMEKGPFSLYELKAMDLQLTDMVRGEEEDDKWRSIQSIEELRGALYQTQDKSKSHWKVNTSFRCISFLTNTRFVSHTSWFLVVVAVLIFDFIIIKSIVESFNSETQYYSAIKSAFQKEPIPKEKVDNNIQNALVKELVTAPDTNIKVHKSIPAKEEILSLAELKNLLQIKSNKYHVIASGGIDDLQITLYNKSPYFVDAVTIQIDYLRTRRKLVQTESFTTTYIKPNSSKTIYIPTNNKGKKIKYRITNVQSSECKLRKFEI